jgi:hypothetical protein
METALTFWDHVAPDRGLVAGLTDQLDLQAAGLGDGRLKMNWGI